MTDDTPPADAAPAPQTLAVPTRMVQAEKRQAVAPSASRHGQRAAPVPITRMGKPNK